MGPRNSSFRTRRTSQTVVKCKVCTSSKQLSCWSDVQNCGKMVILVCRRLPRTSLRKCFATAPMMPFPESPHHWVKVQTPPLERSECSKLQKLRWKWKPINSPKERDMCKLRISLQFWAFDDHEVTRGSPVSIKPNAPGVKRKRNVGRRRPALRTKQIKWKGRRPDTSYRPTVGHVLVRQPRGENDRPLDMKGLLEAATVIESLMYGAGHVFKGIANFYMHGGSFRNSPSDVEFGQLLARNNSLTSPDLPPYCKTTSLISTRYVGFIWLLLTHGVRTSITLLKSNSDWPDETSCRHS